MPKPIADFSFSLAELALSAMSAYHRACAINGSQYQLADCATLPASVRPRILAEIVLRAHYESRVAMVLSGDTTSDPMAVAAAVLAEIKRTWGDTAVEDVRFRVQALVNGDLSSAVNGQTVGDVK